MVSEGRKLEVDPLWLALYFSILLLSLIRRKAQGLSLPQDHAQPTPNECYAVTRRLLHLADWSGTPRIRTIQVVLAMLEVCHVNMYRSAIIHKLLTSLRIFQYLQSSCQGGETSRSMAWLAGAIRVSQELGLPYLGSDPRIMPADDPALPIGQNARKRRIALGRKSAESGE